MSDHIAEVRELSIHYGPILAVDRVSFEVERGRITCLIGANGAGKTSILRALSGMIEYKGQILFEGFDLCRRTPDKILRLGLAHVPEGRGIFANLTVEENLKLSTWIRGDREAVTKDFEEVFLLFPRLKERWKQNAGTLSGGEQQMLALGRALLASPKLLILDEPSMGLAPRLVSEMFEKIKEINKQGMTIVLVEQNAYLALRVSDTAYVLETGKIVLSGKGDALLNNSEIRKAYLG